MSRPHATVDEHASQAPQQEVQNARVRHTERAARRTAAHIVDGTIAAAGASEPMVAKHLGVSPTLVRGLRSGAKEVTLARVLEMPRSIADAVLDKARRALDDEAPPSGMTPERHALAIGAAYGSFVRELHEALADNSLSAEERRAIVRRVHGEIECLRAFERELEREMRAEETGR